MNSLTRTLFALRCRKERASAVKSEKVSVRLSSSPPPLFLSPYPSSVREAVWTHRRELFKSHFPSGEASLRHGRRICPHVSFFISFIAFTLSEGSFILSFFELGVGQEGGRGVSAFFFCGDLSNRPGQYHKSRFQKRKIYAAYLVAHGPISTVFGEW